MNLEKKLKKVPKYFSVVKAKYLGDYALEIAFSDGHKNTISFKNFIFRRAEQNDPCVSKFTDENLFKTYYIEDGNLNWDDYDMIFPVADLYEKGEI